MKKFIRLQAVAIIFTAVLFSNLIAGEKTEQTKILKTSINHADGLYKVGEKVIIKIKFNSTDGKKDAAKKIPFTLRLNDFTTVKKGTLNLSENSSEIEYTFTAPGWLLLTLSPPWKKPDGKPVTTYAGVMCEPEKLRPGKEKPKDFEKFWAGKKKNLDDMPFEPELVPIAKLTNAKVETYAIVLKSINGSKIHGFFAKPKGEGKFPAMMLVHGAGVYGITPASVYSYASKGAIAIDINAHDIPNGKPKAFYAELWKNQLKRYTHQGRKGREKSYFLRMFCSCYRAAQYLTSRKEWNGKQFVVSGSSQGGGQAYVTASLCPKVTAFAANVPALCDHGGREAGRKAGWPTWVIYKNGKAESQSMQASRYYDCTNFARTIKAKALVSAGFIDRCCSPCSVYAAFNMLRGEKRIVNMVSTGHGMNSEFRKLYYDFAITELGLAKKK